MPDPTEAQAAAPDGDLAVPAALAAAAHPGGPTGDDEGPRHLRDPLGWRAAFAASLPTWLGSRVAVALTALAGTWVVLGTRGDERPAYLTHWDNWDVDLFRKIAQHGYFSDAYADRTEAFFPGLPLLLRVVHLLVPSWTAAGVLVSLVAGAIGAAALWKLTAEEAGPAAGGRAVTYLVLFPYAVFLFAGYSEALFLALALPSWLAARRGRWRDAALLAAAAVLVRVTALCLVAGLGIEYLVSRRRAGKSLLGVDVLWFAAPVVAYASFTAYLHSKTGHWDAYSRALRESWGRDFPVSPIKALKTTWGQAQNLDQGGQYLWSWRAELIAVLIGLVLVGVLLYLRRYGEATYVGTNLVLIMFNTFYASGVRAMLVWWPLFILLARVTEKREWLHSAYVWVCAPLMVVLTVTFTQGGWIG